MLFDRSLLAAPLGPVPVAACVCSGQHFTTGLSRQTCRQGLYTQLDHYQSPAEATLEVMVNTWPLK